MILPWDSLVVSVSDSSTWVPVSNALDISIEIE